MEPTSALFIALVAILAVAAAGLTAWSWNWAKLRWLRRSASLLVTQLMVVLTVLVGVNAWQGFFTTWDDVLQGGVAGNPDAGPVVALPPSADQPQAQQSQLLPAVAAGEKANQRHPASGVMVATAIHGRRTGYSLPARIYFPAAYFDKAHPKQVFPVVEFFTGFYGGLDIFQRTLGASAVMDQLIGKHKMPPAVVVIPEQNPHLPADSECVDAVNGDRADTYLSEDVPEVVRSELRVGRGRESWALMGYSTGGYCAANLAIRHPAEFSAVVSLSGYFHALSDATTGDLYKGDDKARLANTPTHTVGLPRRYALAFYLTSTTGDAEGMQGLKDLGPRIHRPDSLTKVVNGPGGHNFRSWHKALPGAFEWIGKTLRIPAVASATGSAGSPPRN
ncbi:MAG: esterase [Actinomycetia bacterium]|nr:esterase [Actinomycetes bacterium]